MHYYSEDECLSSACTESALAGFPTPYKDLKFQGSGFIFGNMIRCLI